MATQFSFDASYLQTAGTLERAYLTKGTYPGLDYPNYASGVAPDQSISTRGGVDVFAMTLVAGQTYKFDIDNASIDLEIDIINQAGQRVGGNDDSSGSDNPFLSFTASRTGTYFIAVHHAANDYVDGFFDWERPSAPTGSYRFFVSAQTMPSYSYNLSDASQSLSYSNNSQEVLADGGNDAIWLNGGNDIGLGGSGSDRLYGGSGMDELSGQSGSDRLEGGSGDDVLRGGSEGDRLFGGTERDGLSGGTGDDQLSGGSGRDTLWGEAGRDTVFGGDGDDFIRGGGGLDRLYGGAGDDTFHFLRGEAPASSYSNEDRIEDFRVGDRIDFSDLLFGELGWRGARGFSAANQVQVVELSNGYTDVRVNLDGDSASELEVLVRTSGFDLLREDFIL
jgi:Ca2+-binding RTX toxin-like protein